MLLFSVAHVHAKASDESNSALSKGYQITVQPHSSWWFFSPLDGKDESDEQDWIKVDTKEKCSLVNPVF